MLYSTKIDDVCDSRNSTHPILGDGREEFATTNRRVFNIKGIYILFA